LACIAKAAKREHKGVTFGMGFGTVQDSHNGMAVGPGSRTATIFSYLVVALGLGSYLLCVGYEAGFWYFLVVFVLVLAVMAIVNFEAAFLFVPLSLTNPYALTETGTALHLSELVLLVIFAVWAVRMLGLSRRPVLPREFLLPAGVILIAAIASLANARYRTASLLQILRYVEILFAFFILVLHECRDPRTIRKVFLYLMVGGFFSAVVGLGQFATYIAEGEEGRRIYGWHGGGYGAVIGSTIFLSMAALLYEKRGVIRLWAVATIPLAALALLFSQTRAWIGALIAVSIIIALRMRRRILIGVMVSLASIVLVTAVVVQTDAFGLVHKGTMFRVVAGAFRFGAPEGQRRGTDLSMLMRLNVWRNAANHCLAHPLVGIGVGNLRYENYYTAKLGDPSRERIGYVDNQYVQFFAEAGIAAGIAWLVLIVQAVRVGLRALDRARNTNLSAVALGLYASLLVYVLGMLLWVITPTHELFALLIVYIALLWNITRIPPATRERIPGTPELDMQ
jgi:O-antigen ligase